MFSFSQRFFLFAIFGILAGAGAISTAEATSFFARPFPDTVQDSSVIVRGRIGKSNSDWGSGSDGTRRLYTFTTSM